MVHGGYGYGVKNNVVDIILAFASSCDLMIENICFKKWDEHLISFRSGSNYCQIVFFPY